MERRSKTYPDRYHPYNSESQHPSQSQGRHAGEASIGRQQPIQQRLMNPDSSPSVTPKKMICGGWTITPCSTKPAFVLSGKVKFLLKDMTQEERRKLSDDMGSYFYRFRREPTFTPAMGIPTQLPDDIYIFFKSKYSPDHDGKNQPEFQFHPLLYTCKQRQFQPLQPGQIAEGEIFARRAEEYEKTCIELSSLPQLASKSLPADTPPAYTNEAEMNKDIYTLLQQLKIKVSLIGNSLSSPEDDAALTNTFRFSPCSMYPHPYNDMVCMPYQPLSLLYPSQATEKNHPAPDDIQPQLDALMNSILEQEAEEDRRLIALCETSNDYGDDSDEFKLAKAEAEELEERTQSLREQYETMDHTEARVRGCQGCMQLKKKHDAYNIWAASVIEHLLKQEEFRFLVELQLNDQAEERV